MFNFNFDNTTSKKASLAATKFAAVLKCKKIKQTKPITLAFTDDGSLF